VDRLSDRTAVCRTGRYARVSSYGPHHGEEDCLRGRRGSGTIFFSGCGLRCVFCQNHDISQTAAGEPVMPDRLAAMMVELQAFGCHNINLVTPEHVVPQILEALPRAVASGLRLPIVYNTSAYDALESLRLLDGVVDVYMPDLKFAEADAAALYCRARDYPQAARRAILEMHRQVGDLVFDENGLALRGLLVRHLVMPGGVAGTPSAMRFLAALSRHTYVNLMDQYRPAYLVLTGGHPEIARPINAMEYDDAMHGARAAGLYRFDARS